MPETLESALLKKKAKKLRKETGDPNYRTLEELESPPFSQMMATALWRPLVMLFSEPILAFMTMCTVFITLVFDLELTLQSDLSFIYSILCEHFILFFFGY